MSFVHLFMLLLLLASCGRPTSMWYLDGAKEGAVVHLAASFRLQIACSSYHSRPKTKLGHYHM